MTNRRFLFDTFAVAITFALSVQTARAADDTAKSPEEQRFAAAKQAQRQSHLLGYLLTAKSRVEQAWHPPDHAELQITKVKLTLNTDGKVADCSTRVPSRSKEEDASIIMFLKSNSFAPLPDGVGALQLFLTFMSDGTMNMVEFTDSTEANEYNKDVLGGTITPTGILLRSGRGTFARESSIHVPSILDSPKDDAVAPFMADLQRRIKRAWFPPKGDVSRIVVVQFKIYNGGNITDLKLDHPSGLASADQAALDAVNHAAPFRPLPAGSAANGMEIQFTFDYDTYVGGGRGVILRKF